MFRRRLAFALAALVIACAPAASGAVTRGDLTLTGLQVRASLGVNPNTGGYMTVTNKGPADALVGASCTCAARVELHVMSHEGGIMRMNEVSSLAVPAKGRLELKPGGAHLMFLGTRAPLKAGTEVPVTLTFRRAGAVTARFEVVAAPSAGEHGSH